MNLEAASALQNIAAGGSGSGRKAVTKHSKIVAHPELHKMLKYQGFRITGTKPSFNGQPGHSTYEHAKTGARAKVHDDGNWSVTYPKEKVIPKITTKGKAKPKVKKMAAGGPGSGPHPGLHTVATAHGFELGSHHAGDTFYNHPAGHRLRTDSEGNWTLHESGKHEVSKGVGDTGFDVPSPRRLAQTLTKRNISAGGPGRQVSRKRR